LRIEVQGNERTTVEGKLAWILRDNGLVQRVNDGGDASIHIDANLERRVAMLAGTDLTMRVHMHADGLDEEQAFTRAGLSSGVPTAEEELATEATMWALGRAAAHAAAPARVATPPTADPGLGSAPQAAPTPHKKRKRRR
jgi:hypothetical protein